MNIPRKDIEKAIIYWSRHCGKRANNALTIVFLAPFFAEEPSKGLCATMYHTGSYDGDIKQYERLRELVSVVK